MTDFGFSKSKPKGERSAPVRTDFSDLPRGPVAISPTAEKAVVARGNELGFTDRGDGVHTTLRTGKGHRKRSNVPPPPPKETLFIRTPEDLADWYRNYCDVKGYRTLWEGLRDFRDMIEAEHVSAAKGRAKA